MGTPRCNPRAILRDSLSTLVPKEGAGRTPSEATNSKRAFVLTSEELKNIGHIAHPNHVEDVYGPKRA